jgi:hypothetical protein
VLGRILGPGVNLCLWQRPTQRAIALELLHLRSPELPDARCPTSSASFDDNVCALLRQQDLDPSTFENWRIDLVHRSPPIAGTGQTRVLFCLDC